jgi:hypothetical protein
MVEYQLTDSDIVIRTADGAYIPDDPANRDRQTFDQWIADGGVPDPAPLPPEPPPPAPLELPPVMPTEPDHAAPKGYVDAEIIKMRDSLGMEVVAPLTERMEAVEARMVAVERQLR